MQGDAEIERKIHDMLLGLDDENFSRELEETFKDLSERDRRISETLEELLEEVDELMLLADQLEEEEHSSW